ncbi:MAG TPA: 4-hydroxy-tetrahydrodipicolinate synthase [Persephonella sp.]|uniref:4-hydroxy-tetrahydrodipicolinate synthase n=1 Tax=Persephonella marina (strain DSM 14350 / EX-H1) TaxID=123214 RepID=DAPA_PERMH|nr:MULTISPECIES: 4-hydroxy-tetrahydrodipicolinate synthase [Persephonella]C0QT41.1 RecName: Full=4-hydroxy-tetrahydrodipicolinate synthase; Short=HTPA synthase [Persephonella marina EX-H1]ACO03721.1 dihydrodipicolinate synthase [Persephonella marina EX-H1]HCB70525.1 4-hydroxy-tetrahydrodipicolinate synthase [Persephonella sp.]
MFKGSIVALITPFKDGAIDRKSLKRLIDFHVEKGTDGIVIAGTTGESATLTFSEHEDLIKMAVEFADKRIPIIAGTGANATHEAIALTKSAEKAGADGSLQIVPYYNKPTQEGIYQHFKAIAEETSIPLILYNIPSRTGVDMLPETFARLYSDFPNVIGIKEATGNVARVSEMISLTNPDVVILSGDDALTLPMMAVGAKGVISVANNLVPEDIATMCRLALEGRFEEARQIHDRYWKLFKTLFIETNPIPVKTAAYLMGLIDDIEMRLPLYYMKPENEEKLKSVLKDYGLIR